MPVNEEQTGRGRLPAVGDQEQRRDGLDAVLVCGSEYSGFEGAVTYMSGFTIVHRYAYVLLPVEGEPAIVFPAD